MAEENKRGTLLTIFAVLFVLLGISNLSKPLSHGRAGFVFLGTKTSGAANAILGPAFGVFLLVYAYGIWRQKKRALPMAWAYAVWVPLNMMLFTMKTPHQWQSPFFAAFYMAVAIGVSWGSALILTRRRALLT
jgi:F0F1-type ATP synthase membrane subunit a